MKIDTLFLSGGGINCLSTLGSFQYFFENNILDSNLTGIKNIVSVSGSSIIILPILLKIPIDSIIELFINYNKEIIDFNEFHINNLFTDLGLYNIDFLDKIIIMILDQKKISKNITLNDLYKLTSINLVIKVININKKKIEYINYLSDPDIPILQLIKMTCCIPFIFKPIEYNGNKYNDGGISGNFPIEYNNKIKTKNYLGIHICSKKKRTEVKTIQDYLKSLYELPFSPYDIKKNKKIIIIKRSYNPLSFNAEKNEKMKRINLGYNETKKHFHNLKHNDSILHENEG